MIKKIKTLIVASLSLGLLAAGSMSPAFAHAITGGGNGSSSLNNSFTSGISQGVDCTSNSGGQLDLSGGNNCTSVSGTGATLGSILTTTINVMSIIIGAIAVIMIIIGGFKYVTSGGNDSNVASAKNTIIYAIVGLVIVALAQVIVHFVLTRFT